MNIQWCSMTRWMVPIWIPGFQAVYLFVLESFSLFALKELDTIFTGRIKAIQLEYSEAHRILISALRKAPQATAVGFKQMVSLTLSHNLVHFHRNHCRVETCSCIISCVFITCTHMYCYLNFNCTFLLKKYLKIGILRGF